MSKQAGGECFDPLCEKHNSKQKDWKQQAIDNEKVIQELGKQLAAAVEALKAARPYLHPGPVPSYVIKDYDAALAKIGKQSEVEIYYDNRNA